LNYESLLKQAEEDGVDVVEHRFSNKIKGLYIDDLITLNSNIDTTAEKACVLAEELGHHYTSSGDITNTNIIKNAKQERQARGWGYQRLVPLTLLIEADSAGIKSRYELAEYLNITEKFLQAALDYYKVKYGLYIQIDNYIILFEPLAVMKKL